MGKKIFVQSPQGLVQVKRPYIGYNNVAQKIKKGYIGVNNVAQQFYGNVEFVWEKRQTSATGTLIGYVTSDNPLAYPMNGKASDNYYYIMVDREHTITYTGDYTDEIVYMVEDSNYYRLLTLTSSGTLNIDKQTECEIWACGAGGNGANIDNNQRGGGGGYADSTTAEIQMLNVVIGAAGSGSNAIGGDTTVSTMGTIVERSTNTNLGNYSLISGSFKASSHESYFQGIVGSGENATTTTTNYYSANSSTIAVFSYSLGFTLPSNAVVTRVYCKVSGHAESSSQENEYMCVQLMSGETALCDEYNFKAVGTTNTIITLEATTLPSIAQLSSMKLNCRLGYYGGAINGATCYVEYRETQGSGGSNDILGGNKTAQGTTSLGDGGSGGGAGAKDNVVGNGDSLSKYPFNSGYFVYPYCDGGSGGGSSSGTYYVGGTGGINGSNGFSRKSYSGASVPRSPAGGHYGGEGGGGLNEGMGGGDATGYGSGGGGCGRYILGSGAGGTGYQGVCFIRYPLFEGETFEKYPLPPEYTELEYVTSNGNQCVNTGFVLTNNYIVECDFALTGTSSSVGYILDSYYYNNGVPISFSKSSSNVFQISANDTTTSFSTTVNTTRRKLSLTPTSVTLTTNNTSETKAITTTTQTVSTTLFARWYTGNDYTGYSSMRLYGFRCFWNNVLFRDLIPVKNSSNVAGLYDKISKTFFKSTTGTELAAGPVVS